MKIFNKHISKVHCIGIGGVGVGPIAAYLHEMGIEVSGSDQKANALTQRLEAMGIAIFYKHSAENISEPDLVIYSSAVAENNPEILWAKAHQIPVLKRAQMLQYILKQKLSVAVAGTHGKTTTTGILSYLLEHTQQDPSYIVGGLMQHSKQYFRKGSGAVMVAEADESDGSLTELWPDIILLNNLESDHLINFNHDFNALKNTFSQFLNQCRPGGSVYVNCDDEQAYQLAKACGAPCISIGKNHLADYRIIEYHQEGLTSYFKIAHQQTQTAICLHLPGIHNAYNATMAFACAHGLGIEAGALVEAMRAFKGVGRRFHVTDLDIGKQKKITVINDYGHHPTEIAHTYQAAREAYPNAKVHLIFEPHRFSRTQELFQSFVDALKTVEHVIILDTFTAGETPLAGAGSKDLLYAIQQQKNCAEYIASKEALFETIQAQSTNKDVWIFQGAGSIGYLPGQLKDFLATLAT